MQRHGSRQPLADTERNSASSTSPLRLLGTAAAAAAAAVLLAACGQGGNESVSSGSGSNSASSGATIATRDIDGAGTVLVDSSGKTVYFADEESDGTIQCTDECLGFWFPVTVSDGATPSPGGDLTQKLGTIKRSDNGQTQVTYNGKPLYTFKLDQSPDDAMGNGFSDSFGSKKFTWHAIDTQGAAAKATANDQSNNGYDYDYGGGGY
ncbi:MAG: hypothetical protein IRY84_05080 [Thermobispora bispora]|nr:hypothetical protein [Thermobispora bispora]